jgi:hypothetical protein
MNIDRVNPGNLPGEPLKREQLDQPKKEDAAVPEDRAFIGKNTAEVATKELTILFYIHGQYPDLARAKAQDFFQLENIGSDENVNVVAELGRAPQDNPDAEPCHIDGDWSGVRRYFVTRHDHSDIPMTLSEWQEVERKIPDNPMAHYELGSLYYKEGDREAGKAEFNRARELGIMHCIDDSHSEDVKRIEKELDETAKPFKDAHKDAQVYGSEVLQSLPEGTKIGDPSTLKDFVAWGMKDYPAHHYVVVVTGHGGAWIGALEINPHKMAEAIEQGKAEAEKETGEKKNIDALVFNSCYMGNLESSYELRRASDIIIGSENYSKGTFKDWGDHLKRIEADIKKEGEFDKAAFAREFVNYYRDSGKEIKENYPEFTRWKESFLTLTAIDSSKLEKLVESWKGFVESCTVNKVPDRVIFGEFAKAQGFLSSSSRDKDTYLVFYDMIKDLGDIMSRTRENPALPEAVKNEAAKVEKALHETVIAEQHEGKEMDDASGITLWAPSNAVDIALMADRYEKENVPEFVAASGYLPMLKDATKHVDQKALKSFMGDIGLIRNIRRTLNDPAVPLTEREKKILKEGEKSLNAHAVKLKKDLDITAAKMQTLSKGAPAMEPDFGLIGAKTRDIVDDELRKATPDGGG